MIIAKTRPSKQVYENYTNEDFEVWSLLYERQLGALRDKVSVRYLKALKTIGFSASRIPEFGEVNDRLKNLTGWSLVVVPNISPQREFFEHLSQRRFTATCWLRTLRQLDYLEEPDMFHDVFGHVPLLTNKAYCRFFEGVSSLAMNYADNPKAIELLGRLYWFTIEFGLIKEDGATKIYGAGIISSKGETEFCLSLAAKRYAFDVSKVFDTSFRTDKIQDTYFVIDSFDQLYSSLDLVEQELIRRI